MVGTVFIGVAFKYITYGHVLLRLLVQKELLLILLCTCISRQHNLCEKRFTYGCMQ